MRNTTEQKQTNEARMSDQHKADLRGALEAVLQLLSEPEPLTGERIERVSQHAFREGTFPELKGKLNPRFSDAVYPRLNEAFFAKEMSDVISASPRRGTACELMVLASQGSPVTRLLAAYIWKRGELDRVKQVLDGMTGTGLPPGDVEVDDDGPAVMWQFGRHLMSPSTEPICDQHTYRSFVMLREALAGKPLNFNQQKHDSLTRDEIDNYVVWWRSIVKSKNFPQEPQAWQDAAYRLDRLLFSLGKSARPPPRRKRK
jgi:hypothetical protein